MDITIAFCAYGKLLKSFKRDIAFDMNLIHDFLEPTTYCALKYTLHRHRGHGDRYLSRDCQSNELVQQACCHAREEIGDWGRAFIVASAILWLIHVKLKMWLSGRLGAIRQVFNRLNLHSKNTGEWVRRRNVSSSVHAFPNYLHQC